jgi:hypothetical protein
MGLQLFGSDLSPLLKIGVIFETFNLCGKVDSFKLLLMHMVNSLTIFFSILLDTPSGPRDDLLERDITVLWTSSSVASIKSKGSFGSLLFCK